jgi:hypothetical protein
VVPTAADRRRWAKVAALGCQACLRLGYGDSETGIHHVRQQRLGMRNHKAVIGLCALHHVGLDTGIHHMSHADWEAYTGLSEQAMLRLVDSIVPHA